MRLCLLLTLALSQFGCRYPPYESPNKKLASQMLTSEQKELATQLHGVTRDYLEKYVSPGFYGKHGKTFCAFRVLDIEQQGTTIKEYVFYLCQEYDLENGDSKKGTGGAEPIALSIQQQEDKHYAVIKRERAAEGEPWHDDVIRIFPKKTHAEIFSFEPLSLRKDIEDEANKYFGKQGQLHRLQELKG